MEVDPELVVPDPQATLGEGAIQPWSQAHVADYFLRLMGALGEELGFDLNTPWEDLPAKAQKSLLDGHPTKVHVVTRNRYGRERAYYAEFEGVQPYIERRHREAESDTSRERFEGFMREVPCPACEGSRLKPVSMAVTLGDTDAGGKNIAEVCALPINETADFLRDLELTARERQIGERVLKEIQERLNFLLDVGLDYLSLDRPVGLAVRRRGPADPAGHPDRRRPGRRPLRPRRAVDRPAPARQPPADRDPGPAQGPRQHPDRRRARRGHHPQPPTGSSTSARAPASTAARSSHSGTVKDLLEHPDSMTGQYLSGRREIPVPAVRRPRTTGRELTVHGRHASTTCATST